ncbi:MAG TPA: GAF domain-containing protein, partial [Thermomicrobiales bacterium]|nr:GAF domain-containing protein [Thermomicrobiales bacterium]
EAVTIARVCDIAAPVLHRLRTVERLRHRVAESETIRRLTDSVARTPSFVGALDTICRSAQLITGLDLVATAATTSDYVIWKSACGASDPSFLDTRIEMPNDFLRNIMRRGQEVVMRDVRNHPVLEPRFMPVHTREGLRSSVTTPVYVNARLRALMLFGSRRLREFSRDEVMTMHAIAGTVATAIAASEARMSDGGYT